MKLDIGKDRGKKHEGFRYVNRYGYKESEEIIKTITKSEWMTNR